MSRPFWTDMPFYREKLERQRIRRINGPLTESAWWRLTKDWGELQPELALYLTEWMERNRLKLKEEMWLLTHAPGTKKVRGRRWFR